jgi:CRISPR-associated Csx3 family protein
MTWSPKHLALLSDLVPASQPLAIYGRGPVWLTAALAALTLPESFAIFDARYGWLRPPPIHFDGKDAGLKAITHPYPAQDSWIAIELPGGTLEPDAITLPRLHPQGGLVLSGKIPRWLFATLVHALAPAHDWIAVDDPHLLRAVVVHSNTPSRRAGDTLPRLAWKKSS